MRFALRWTILSLRIGIGLYAVGFAVNRWLWYENLAPRSDARICGTCFMGSVGAPVELGLLGLPLIAGAFANGRGGLVIGPWLAAILGVLLSFSIVGVPLFLFAYYALILAYLRVGFAMPQLRAQT